MEAGSHLQHLHTVGLVTRSLTNSRPKVSFFPHRFDCLSLALRLDNATELELLRCSGMEANGDDMVEGTPVSQSSW